MSVRLVEKDSGEAAEEILIDLNQEGAFEHDLMPSHDAGWYVEIETSKGTIKRLRDLREPGKEIYSADLEPELITGLFEQVWEERRLVNLAAAEGLVPPPGRIFFRATQLVNLIQHLF